MRIVIPGGSGKIGTLVARAFHSEGDEVVVLSRSAYGNAPWQTVKWDLEKPEEWEHQLVRADVVINLAGRSVNCRYTPENRREILESRTKSVLAVGKAISRMVKPPKVWLQASTATVYAHRYDAPNDEATGIIGGNEPNAPDTWRFSIDVAKAWEKAFDDAETPGTRKVLLRSAMTMSPDMGGVFDVLSGLARRGLGGSMGDGKQFVSWIHEVDFVRAVRLLIDRDDLEGPVNISSPNPVPNAEFMRTLREVVGVKFGPRAPVWALELGARFMRTETELILKSRRVVPKRLMEAGFEFEFLDWKSAATDLHRQMLTQQ